MTDVALDARPGSGQSTPGKVVATILAVYNGSKLIQFTLGEMGNGEKVFKKLYHRLNFRF